MGLEPIKTDEAHLWYGRADRAVDPRVLHRYRTLLSQDERQKLERYRFAKDRDTGLLTRVMVRCLLSRYCTVEPPGWQFQTNRYGRPEIAMPKRARALRFSVAHTRRIIVVLVSKNRDLGIDVESVPYDGPSLQIADRLFSPLEVSDLRSLPVKERAARFIQYWTLKEAFLKARGVGLSAPLDEFSFSLDEAPADSIAIRFDPSFGDNPERWQFGLHDIGEDHLIATAIERRGHERIRLVRREVLGRAAAGRPWPSATGLNQS